MEIQPLSKDNLQALITLVLALWPECNFDEEYDFYKSIIDAPNEVCYMIKENNDFLAFIHATIRTDYVEGADESPVAYIEALYVKPEYQNTGIGKSLVKAIEKWSLQKGCKEIASDTQLNNIKAINFHKKIGFEETNRIVCFIKKIE